MNHANSIKQEELIKKYPHLEKIAEFTIFTTEEDIKQIKNGKKIRIGSDLVCIEFLKRILKDDYYYEYANKYFNGKINDFRIGYIVNGDLGTSIHYEKIVIIKALQQLVSYNKLHLNDLEMQRYSILKNCVSLRSFELMHKGSFYINIDGNEYSINSCDMVSLMQLSNSSFNELCNNNDIKTIHGIRKEYFIYATYMYFKIYKGFEEFIMPNSVINRFNDIKSLQKIDFQAINEHLTTSDTKYKEAIISDSLEHEILDDMPNNLTLLEKSIYVYIKMCKILNYDGEYYATNQEGIVVEKHKNIDYIQTITPTNNEIVCFEFNLIYSKILNSLGINFKSNYKNMVEEEYGDSHANLEYRVDKYLVIADAVTSILQSDMVNAKLNKPLNGLICININNKTQYEFEQILEKVYKLIITMEIKSNKDKNNLNELLIEYSKITDNIKTIDMSERLSILKQKINLNKYIGMTSLSYILNLRNLLFDIKEQKDNANIVIVRNNSPLDKNKIALPTAVLLLNNYSIKDKTDETNYYIYNPCANLESISLSDLQNLFNNGIFEYIQKDSPKIPGILERGGLKK
ncbi:MAG: hypothetical protein NC181_02945 [Clostridium sp.]|nr:hypothetical protein [Clostridium sp.]MCM1444194.1 hypothetical protein [Candidatus Amulumruptor caecigallinarius]